MHANAQYHLRAVIICAELAQEAECYAGLREWCCIPGQPMHALAGVQFGTSGALLWSWHAHALAFCLEPQLRPSLVAVRLYAA